MPHPARHDADWTIVPGRGLGRLTFGLTPEEVAALAPVYGRPGPVKSHAHVAEDVEKVIATPGMTLSPDDVAMMRREAAALANFATQTLIGATTILLDYRDLRLVAVGCEARRSAAHVDGRRIDAMASRDVVALFERANGGPGRYRLTEAAFDDIAVSLHAFCHTSRAGVLRFLDQTDDAFEERSVTLRNEPYRPAGEMDQFFTRPVP